MKSLAKFQNTAGFQDFLNSEINNAIMIFEPGNVYIERCIQELASDYDKESWAWQGPGICYFFYCAIAYVWGRLRLHINTSSFIEYQMQILMM